MSIKLLCNQSIHTKNTEYNGVCTNSFLHPSNSLQPPTTSGRWLVYKGNTKITNIPHTTHTDDI